MWLVLATWFAGITAAAELPTSTEEAALRAGQVVTRDMPTRGGPGVRVVAFVDVHAGRDAVWAALLDFPSRKLSNPAVQRVDYYKPSTPTDQWVRWEVSKFGFEIIYSNHYAINRAAGTLLHELDRTQENDLARSLGLFTLSDSPLGAGWTRLTYDVESDFGRALPGFVQSWMTSSGTRDFMAELARKAAGH